MEETRLAKISRFEAAVDGVMLGAISPAVEMSARLKRRHRRRQLCRLTSHDTMIEWTTRRTPDDLHRRSPLCLERSASRSNHKSAVSFLDKFPRTISATSSDDASVIFPLRRFLQCLAGNNRQSFLIRVQVDTGGYCHLLPAMALCKSFGKAVDHLWIEHNTPASASWTELVGPY